MTPLPLLRSCLHEFKLEKDLIADKLKTGHNFYSPGQLYVYRKRRTTLNKLIKDTERKIHLHPDNHDKP